MKSTQGRRCYANPGLSDHNPVGVAGDLIFNLGDAHPSEHGIYFQLFLRDFNLISLRLSQKSLSGWRQRGGIQGCLCVNILDWLLMK